MQSEQKYSENIVQEKKNNFFDMTEPIELDLTDEQAFIVSVFIREGELRERERIIALLEATEELRTIEAGWLVNYADTAIALIKGETLDNFGTINYANSGDVVERRQMQMSEYGDKGETE